MEKVEKILLDLMAVLPGHVYWKDKEGKYLGCNDLQAKTLGLVSRDDIIGKTDFDLVSEDEASMIRQNDIDVMTSQCSKTLEEKKLLPSGEVLIYLSKKVPLKDPKNGEVCGILGISFDITMQKNLEAQLKDNQEEVESTLENILTNLPEHVYWMDRNNLFLGCNDKQAKTFGLDDRRQIRGKTIYDYEKKEEADHIIAINNTVMATGKSLSEEEPYTTPEGEKKIFLSKKTPLFNKNNDIIGVLGISFDITENKKLEEQATELKVENALQKKALGTQKRFNEVASQVAHDIRSPLATLMMVVKSCDDIPETERIALREAATRISDIANSLLKRFTIEQLESSNSGLEREASINDEEPLLVSTLLMQLITDKKYEYPHMGWELEIASNAHFIFIAASATKLKRSLSNLINNAVDACSAIDGRIVVRLAVDGSAVSLRIEDNGKGIPPDILKKIISAVAVTSGKDDGHGIGLMQVRETLQAYQGSIEFDSALGLGTQVTLTFPRVVTPDWMADCIQLKPGDNVVILDDDASIHGAWDTRFQSIIDLYPSIKLHHFTQGKAALDFIKAYPHNQRQEIFLLADFELLKQNLDGLMVIEESQLSRTLLVTSYYMNPSVRHRAAQVGCKILPKQMASEISIEVKLEENTKPSDTVIDTAHEEKNQIADLVIVDDDLTLARDLSAFVFSHQKVDVFESPEALLNELHHYALDIPILLDNNFRSSRYSGISLAEALHQQGFVQLFLLSGQIFGANEVPDYLTVILKDDIDRLEQLF